jgi:hypothetical protein
MMRKLINSSFIIVGLGYLSTLGGCGGQTPPAHTANWWYYWKDGTVIDDMGSTKWLWGGAGTYRGLSSPHKTTSFVGVGDASIAERTSNLSLVSVYDYRIPPVPVAVEVSGAKGIDSVAITISHEFRHVWVYQQWGMRIGVTGPGHADTDAISDTVEDDRTPGSIGETYRFISTDPDCYRMANHFPPDAHYGIYGDNEILARVEGFNNPRATHPERDWSMGGAQWRH